MFRYIQFDAPHRAAMIYSELPHVGPAEALVETRLSGISSGTERMWFEGSAGALRSGRRGYPYRPGYELIGRIAAAGEDFAGPAVGDRVFAMKPHASHAVLGADDLWFRLPPMLGDEDALGIGLTATALHAIDRAAFPRRDGVAVAGLGMLGIIMVQVLAATGVGPVIALTRDPAKARQAHTLGAAVALTYDEYETRRLALPPIETVFECSGVAANVARVLSLPGPRGEIVLAGYYTASLVTSYETIFANELAIKAVRAAGITPAERARNFARATTLVASGKVRIGGLVTHRFAADDFLDAYRLVAARPPDAMQVCLSWS